jgi:hypothetical protein
MTTHIEQLQQRYDQFSRGDIQGAAGEWASDFAWQGGNSAELPMGGTQYGKAAALGVSVSREGGPARPLTCWRQPSNSWSSRARRAASA